MRRKTCFFSKKKTFWHIDLCVKKGSATLFNLNNFAELLIFCEESVKKKLVKWYLLLRKSKRRKG